MSQPPNIKLKMKAVLAANRACRLSLENALKQLKTAERDVKKAEGPRKEYLTYFIDSLDEKLEQIEGNTAQEGGGCGDSGGGFSSGGCAGSD